MSIVNFDFSSYTLAVIGLGYVGLPLAVSFSSKKLTSKKDFLKKVIGFDPVAKLFFNFHFLQKFVQAPELFYEPLGVKSLTYFKSYFDRILCMGLLYHVTDPVQTLRDLHASLKKGGSIIVDTHGIEGCGSYGLFPKKK